MEKVDKLIEDLADHISGILKRNHGSGHEVAEKTKALAELVSARASVLNETSVKISNTNANDLVEKYVHKRNVSG